MKTKPIQSVKDPDDSHPWYEVDINADGEPEIATDNDGGTGFDMGGGTTATVPNFVDLPSPAQKAMSKDTVYAVTTDGQFIAYDRGTTLADHGVSLRAHLAWYDAATDEFIVLEFVEG